MIDLPENAKQSLKSFWQKPEGKIGMWATAIFLGVGFMVFWAKVLPWLIVLASNTLLLGALLAAIFLLVFPFAFSEFRLKMLVGYKLFLRKLAGFIIKTDPIEILKITISRGEERLEFFADQIKKLKGVLSNLKSKVESYSTQAKETMMMAQQAQKKQMSSAVYLNTQQASRLKGAATELSQVYARIEALYRVINKIYENASVVLQDKKSEVELMEDKWVSLRAAHGTMKSAMAALHGNKDDRALFEEVAEYVNNDLNSKVGEIEYMLESSETIMNNIDLRNGMFQEKGMQMLEEFEKKADTWLLLDPAATNVSLSQFKTNEQTGQIQNVNQSQPNNFSTLFK